MKVSLAELEAITAVARHGGFRAAARELGMSSSALSHAVAALEERLSVRIFNRTTRSVALSEAGERFVADVAPALAAIDRAIEDAGMSAGTVSGTLRLNMAPGAARMILAPLVFAYLRRYPKAGIDLVTEGALVDVVGQGFDAGIRLAEFVPPDMIAVPISRLMCSAVVGSPGYFKSHGRPKTPAELKQHRCIRARMASGVIYRWEFEKRGESLALDVPGPLILDESGLMLQAALAGEGLAYLADFTTAGHVSAGRLERVLEDWLPAYPGLCLYYPSRRHVPAKLRAFIELVREQSK